MNVYMESTSLGKVAYTGWIWPRLVGVSRRVNYMMERLPEGCYEVHELKIEDFVTGATSECVYYL
jgi:hypothetical protein